MPGLYLDRAAWGADLALGRLGSIVPRSQFTALAVHHTVIVMQDYDRDGYTHGDVDDIRRYMRALQTARPDLAPLVNGKRLPPDVPYSFVVFRGADEYGYVVCEGRGFDRTGAHTQGGYNRTAYGVALAGDFTHVAPTIGMLAGVRWVGAQLEDPVGARPTVGHRDVHATACPGDLAYPLLDRLQPPFTASSPQPPDPAPVPAPIGAQEMRFYRTEHNDIYAVYYARVDGVLRLAKAHVTGPDWKWLGMPEDELRSISAARIAELVDA
jgi:hypothetical protein